MAIKDENNTFWIKEQIAVFNALVDPALIYDQNLNVVEVNLSFLERYNCNPVGLNVKEVISTFACKWLDDSRYVLKDQPTAKALRGEKTSGAIFSIKYNGEEQLVETSSSPIWVNNTVVGALTVWHSIDDLEKIRQNFIKSEALHRKIYDHSPIGIIIHKNDSLEYANSAALKIVGVRHILDIEGKTLFDFIPGAEKGFNKHLHSLQPGEKAEFSELKMIKANGEEVFAEVNVINTSESGNEIFQFFIKDITSRKKTDMFQNVLSSLEQVLHNTTSIYDVTQKKMEIAAKALECDSAAVSFFKETEWEVQHIYKFDKEVKGMHIALEDEPHANLALKEKKILFIEDTFTDPRVNNQRLKDWGIRSVIVVPLFTPHKKIGAIFFNYKREKVFSDMEVHFLLRLSNSLSLALENTELLENLQNELKIKEDNERKLIRLNNILRAISRSSQALVHAVSEKDYVSRICKIITEDCNQALAWVGFVDDKGVAPKVWSGSAKKYMANLKYSVVKGEQEDNPVTLAIKFKKPYVCNNLADGPNRSIWRKKAVEAGLHSIISLPLIHQNEVYGILNIYSIESNFYTTDETLLLTELAQYLSQGIIFLRLEASKRQTEESLRESEERFRMLTEKSNALICELDPEGRVLYANAKFLDIFGWNKSFTGSLLDCCADDDQKLFHNFIFQNEMKSKTEWILKDKNLNWRWFRCHPGIFKTSRGVQHFSLVMFDITEIKNQEILLKKKSKELKDLNATKDKFFAIIAHDLKNPFASLIGASEFISQGMAKDSETIIRLGKMINSSAQKGFELLQNLLDWSRSQTGTISFEPKLYKLSRIVSECWDNVRPSACAKSQNVQINVPDNILVYGDNNMLTTVLRNLMQNAVKFTHTDGEIKVVARNGKKAVTVSVEDSGVGLSAENIRKLFRIDIKFSQPGTNKETGTGLGLLLCKEFVEKHGGRIWITSKVGKGSKFSFTIPHATVS